MTRITKMCIVAFVLSNLFSLSSNAQKGFEIGVYATPANSWILNKEDQSSSFYTGSKPTFAYSTGILGGFNLTKNLGIQTGLAYTQMGQKRDVINTTMPPVLEDLTEKRSLTYYRVPILVKYSLPVHKVFELYFRVGPHLDILSKAQLTTKSGDTQLMEIEVSELNITDDQGNVLETNEPYNKLVWGATVEMGTAINLNQKLQLLALLHLDSSLSNPEGESARFLYPSTGTFPDVERGTAWNVMAGFTLGLHYNLSNN